MDIQTISTKQLRQDLPEIRKKLDRGTEFILIHRSRPIASITPLKKQQLKKIKSISEIAGNHRFEEKLGRKLTPEFLNKLAEERYHL